MIFEDIYYVKDVSRIIDRDKSTIFRWEKEGKINFPRRDSRGWRIYSSYDIEKMKRLVSEISRMYN
jgi:DNA-binding transcriptional MerR regulator